MQRRCSTNHVAAILERRSSVGVHCDCGSVRRLNLTDCNMYLDGQQYFISMAVLDISRKATAVKERRADLIGTVDSIPAHKTYVSPAASFTADVC